MDRRLTYAYAVLRPPTGLAQTLAGLRGVANAPVALVDAEALAAAVSQVPERDFTEQALRVRLEDLDWLEVVARAHHSVIDTLSAHTTVLPLRLATVYLDDTGVRRMLTERQHEFTELLDRLAAHVEWGVKVYADLSAASPAEPSAHPEPEVGSAPGRAYLQRRRQQRRTQEAAWRAAEEAVRRIDGETRALAVERARHQLQQGRLAGGSGENVTNDAYLVPHHLAEEFRARVLRAAEGLPGVRVEVTGPWAPYSFTALAERTREGAPPR